jgi:NADPH-dependent glutamate synthase beta subunit-like oxidoreductase
MPAYREEVEAAEAEGIKIYYLAAPSKIIGKDGKVVGLECIRTELGEPDESGRRRPIPMKGSEFIMAADTIISAIGEVPDLSFLETKKFNITSKKTINVHPYSLVTNVGGIFAGGDVVSGPATVIEAIASGRKAAISMDEYLRGRGLEYEEQAPSTINTEDVDMNRFNKRERQKMSMLPVGERIRDFREVELGFTELAALSEADRCFQCGLFPKKDK